MAKLTQSLAARKRERATTLDMGGKKGNDTQRQYQSAFNKWYTAFCKYARWDLRLLLRARCVRSSPLGLLALPKASLLRCNSQSHQRAQQTEQRKVTTYRTVSAARLRAGLEHPVPQLRRAVTHGRALAPGVTGSGLNALVVHGVSLLDRCARAV